MRGIKTALTVIGAVTVLALAGNTVVYAATGGKLVLGQSNKASKQTSLKRTTAGPALKLTTTSAAAAPLTTNARGKVSNLDADLLDGLDSSSLKTTSYVYTAPIDAGTTDVILMVPVPAGNYLVSYSATALAASSDANCVLDRNQNGSVTEFAGSGYAGSAVEGRSASGSGFVAKPAGVTLKLHCFGGTDLGTFSGQPIQIVATKVDTVAASATLTPLP